MTTTLTVQSVFAPHAQGMPQLKGYPYIRIRGRYLEQIAGIREGDRVTVTVTPDGVMIRKLDPQSCDEQEQGDDPRGSGYDPASITQNPAGK